jgi:hypothetical protein
VSYAAPILSTLFLVLAGYAVASVPLAVAAALITGGGLLAAKDLIRAPVSSVTNPSGPARSP